MTAICRHGFTLLEIMVAMAIMAIMVSAVAVSASGWFQSAKIEDVAGQVAFIDQIMRVQAKRLQCQRNVIFDLDNQSIMRAGSDEAGLQSHRFYLPDGARLKMIMTAYDRTSVGQKLIPFTRQGHTPTYAVLVASGNDHENWIVIVGLSGQVVTLDEREGIDRIFEQISR